jgi:drug/metabolite transporter (DMT)-like permease
VPIALAFACAVVYGIADYCGGRASRSAPSIAISLFGQVSSLIVGGLGVLLIGTAIPAIGQLGWGGLAGVSSAVALASFYHALSHGSMTVVAPITAVTSAVLPVAFGLFRGERPAVIAYVGMVLAVAAVALVSGAIGERHTATRRSTIAFALVAGAGFAIIFIALGETTSASGIWPLVSSRVVSVAIIGTFAVATSTRVRGHGTVWRLAALAGMLDMSANFLYLLAVRRGLLSLVVVVAALYPLSTVILAFGLDRERVSKSQAAGMAMALGALVLVSLAGSS